MSVQVMMDRLAAAQPPAGGAVQADPPQPGLFSAHSLGYMLLFGAVAWAGGKVAESAYDALIGPIKNTFSAPDDEEEDPGEDDEPDLGDDDDFDDGDEEE